jgi:hypothetical protein
MSLAACFPVLVAGLSVNVPQLLLMGLILAVATGAASIVTRWARPRVPRAHRPRKLFYTLCKAHQLDHSEQRLLSLIAKAVNLANPSEVFLRSDLLASDRLGTQFQPYAQQLARLQTRLFGHSEPSKSN